MRNGHRQGEPVREATLFELVGDVVTDLQQLVRGEVALAKAEIREEMHRAQSGMTSLAAGIALLGVGSFLLAFGLVHVLAAVTPLTLWASYLLVGGVILVIGGVALAVAKNRLANFEPVPKQTIESVKEDVEWVRHLKKSAPTSTPRASI